MFEKVVIGNATLYRGDCMEFLAGCKNKEYDLAIVDPPYGINAPRMNGTPNYRKNGVNSFNGGATSRLTNGGGKLKGRILNNATCNWDAEIPTNEYFETLKNTSNNQIIWGGNYFPLPPSRGVICWDKVQPWPNFSAWEMAWTNFDCPARIFRFDNRTGDKIHPTQKPIELYEWTLNTYAKQGQTILDTHLGSGSSAIAAHNLGFDFLGMELDKDYYDAACKRFEQHKAQGSFFAPTFDTAKQVSLL